MFENSQILEIINWFSYKNKKRINAVLLLTHIAMTVIFAVAGIKAMVCVNVFSASVYIVLMFFFKKLSRGYYIAINVEIMMNMIVSTICTGWKTGFELYALVLISVAFFADYCIHKYDKKTIYPIRLMITASLLFIFQAVWTEYHSPVYTIGKELTILLLLFNTMLTIGTMTYYLACYEKLSQEAEKSLKIAAERDELTGLNNRFYMNVILTNQFNRFKNEKESLSAAMIDVDDFKKINDTYGHSAGDTVLKSVAASIRKISNENIYASRWGGEEFLVVCFGDNSYMELKDKMEELIKNINSQNYSFDGDNVKISITVGAAECREDDWRIEEVISRADRYLYDGKEAGKNRLVAQAS